MHEHRFGSAVCQTGHLSKWLNKWRCLWNGGYSHCTRQCDIQQITIL